MPATGAGMTNESAEQHHVRLRTLYSYPIEQTPIDRAADRLVRYGIYDGFFRLIASRSAQRILRIQSASARLSRSRGRIRFYQVISIRHHRCDHMDRDRLQVSSADDRCRYRRTTGHAPGGAAA